MNPGRPPTLPRRALGLFSCPADTVKVPQFSAWLLSLRLLRDGALGKIKQLERS
jgi:hypothetical protein